MHVMDGTKDPDNPTLLDTREVEYVALRAASQAYVNGSLPLAQLRALQVSSFLTEYEQVEVHGPHPMADFVNEFEGRHADLIMGWPDDNFKKWLRDYWGFDVQTGTVQANSFSLTMSNPDGR